MKWGKPIAKNAAQVQQLLPRLLPLRVFLIDALSAHQPRCVVVGKYQDQIQQSDCKDCGTGEWGAVASTDIVAASKRIRPHFLGPFINSMQENIKIKREQPAAKCAAQVSVGFFSHLSALLFLMYHVSPTSLSLILLRQTPGPSTADGLQRL